MEYKCWKLDVVVLQRIFCKASSVDVSGWFRRTFRPTRQLCEVKTSQKRHSALVKSIYPFTHVAPFAWVDLQMYTGSEIVTSRLPVGFKIGVLATRIWGLEMATNF